MCVCVCVCVWSSHEQDQRARERGGDAEKGDRREKLRLHVRPVEFGPVSGGPASESPSAPACRDLSSQACLTSISLHPRIHSVFWIDPDPVDSEGNASFNTMLIWKLKPVTPHALRAAPFLSMLHVSARGVWAQVWKLGAVRTATANPPPRQVGLDQVWPQGVVGKLPLKA